MDGTFEFLYFQNVKKSANKVCWFVGWEPRFVDICRADQSSPAHLLYSLTVENNWQNHNAGLDWTFGLAVSTTVHQCPPLFEFRDTIVMADFSLSVDHRQ